jgi:diaminohydroxyphosphoribosylaminopyrimidine deaminase/5-amino-6-(5-phosphoribosylamino)uracil reductase
MIENLEGKFKKCFELATLGETLAFPNPNVACLIYHDECLVSYGIHKEFGKAHAEVNAINNLKEIFSKSDLHKKYKSFTDYASECELILNLEPCCHYGNTPPCTSLIIESGFKKISFSSYDTNPKVHKKSLEIFSNSIFELISPEKLSQEIQEKSQFINRAFFSIRKKEIENRVSTYLSLKIASYPNGNMLTQDGARWITCEESRKDVHRLRSTNQILITTSSTIKADNPKYNVRHSAEDLKLLDIKDPDICVLYNKEKILPENTTSTRKIIYEKLDNLDKQTLEKIISELSFQGYQKIMIEAGPTLSKAFIASGLVDELIIYQPKNHRSKEKFIKEVESSFNYISSKNKIFELENDYKLVMLSA